jgi:8-oxo-dGTP diphosphatase
MVRGTRETSAGGVLFRCTPDGPRFLLILDAYGKWGFPKGHLDSGESSEAAARREVREETGLDGLILHERLGQIDWYFRLRGRLIHKFCDFYLFEAPTGDPTPERDEGISSCRWYPPAEALAVISYKNARRLLERAVRRMPELCPERARGAGS